MISCISMKKIIIGIFGLAILFIASGVSASSIWNNYYNSGYSSDYNNCTVVNFNTSQTHITSGNPVVISWNTKNCISTNITHLGNVSSSGQYFFYPTTTANYTLNAYNYNNRAQPKTILIVVNNVIPSTLRNSCAITNIATNIKSKQATVNGLITNSNNLNNNYFEYGTTINLELKTQPKLLKGNNAFSNILINLSPNTIYYFRAVSNCQGILNKGKIEVFKTMSSEVKPNIIQSNKTKSKLKSKIKNNIKAKTEKSSSLVMLKIKDHYKSVGLGDIIEYTISYKNISKSILINPILQVVVPRGIVVTNASQGTYSADTKTLTMVLNNLKKGDGGILYVQGQVKSIPKNTIRIITTASLIYTNTNQSQENAIAYTLNTFKKSNNNSLGAAAFFGGLSSFGLISWLLIIILILVIILIIRRYLYHPSPIEIPLDVSDIESK